MVYSNGRTCQAQLMELVAAGYWSLLGVRVNLSVRSRGRMNDREQRNPLAVLVRTRVCSLESNGLSHRPSVCKTSVVRWSWERVPVLRPLQYWLEQSLFRRPAALTAKRLRFPWISDLFKWCIVTGSVTACRRRRKWLRPVEVVAVIYSCYRWCHRSLALLALTRVRALTLLVDGPNAIYSLCEIVLQ